MFNPSTIVYANQVSVPHGVRYILERGQGQYGRIRRSWFPNLHNSLEMRYLRDWIFVLSFIQIGFLIACDFVDKSLKAQLTEHLFMHMPYIRTATYTNDTELNNNNLDEIPSEELDTRDLQLSSQKTLTHVY